MRGQLNFQTRSKFQFEQSNFLNNISSLALAGAGGIEPPNGGIKIRCLTDWLRPNRLNLNARTMRPARTGSDNARSIEGVRPFQQAGIPNFVRNQLPGSVTLYNRTVYAKARLVSRPWRGPIPPIGVLRQPRFRGNTAVQIPVKARLSS